MVAPRATPSHAAPAARKSPGTMPAGLLDAYRKEFAFFEAQKHALKTRLTA